MTSTFHSESLTPGRRRCRRAFVRFARATSIFSNVLFNSVILLLISAFIYREFSEELLLLLLLLLQLLLLNVDGIIADNEETVEMIGGALLLEDVEELLEDVEELDDVKDVEELEDVEEFIIVGHIFLKIYNQINKNTMSQS